MATATASLPLLREPVVFTRQALCTWVCLHPAGDAGRRTPSTLLPTLASVMGTTALSAATGEAFLGTANCSTLSMRGTWAQKSEAAGNAGAGQETNMTSEEWNFSVRCLQHESQDLGTDEPQQIWPKMATYLQLFRFLFLFSFLNKSVSLQIVQICQTKPFVGLYQFKLQGKHSMSKTQIPFTLQDFSPLPLSPTSERPDIRRLISGIQMETEVLV